MASWEKVFYSILDKYKLVSRLSDLQALADELLRWSKTHNLTAYRNWPDIAMGLMADSLVLCEYCNEDSCLDIGSGAGFPGLMLALACPDMQVTMLDGRRKRVSFQQHAVRMLDLSNASPVWGRAGDDKLSIMGKKYAIATCKALANLPMALELCKIYAKAGGKIVLPRGEGDLPAAHELLKSMPEKGHIHEYELPWPVGKRFVLVVDVEG